MPTNPVVTQARENILLKQLWQSYHRKEYKQMNIHINIAHLSEHLYIIRILWSVQKLYLTQFWASVDPLPHLTPFSRFG